jgi:outer membrane protein assembly factor BamB
MLLLAGCSLAPATGTAATATATPSSPLAALSVYATGPNPPAALLALNAATGEVRWQSGGTPTLGFSGEPVVANGMLYLGGAGFGGTSVSDGSFGGHALYGLDARTGNARWQAPIVCCGSGLLSVA